MPPKKESPTCDCMETIKFMLGMIKLVAQEQASRTTSGSGWLADFNHKIQLKEKELGLGPGPRTERPL